MAHLIDKDALVAEIERRKDKITFLNEFANGTKFGLETAIDVINSLEVKEVDLEKELSYEDYKSFFEKYPDLSDDWGFEEAWTFAQHFFKLGIKAQKGE